MSVAGYEISSDPSRLDFEFVHCELAASYWSPGVSREIVEKAAANSRVYGVYRVSDGLQVGYARVITDLTTFAYLADVVIGPEERGKGLGTWLNRHILEDPQYRTVRRWMLMTKDAHEVYERVGWHRPAQPERIMERAFPDAYFRRR